MRRAMASASTPDFTTLARRPSERLAIVAHVRDSRTVEETDYLEWKSAYDLSSKPGAAATARQLIGMANRDFAQAERHAEGSAYVLIGVEPGMVHGVPHWDSADIENWLARYVVPELRYDPHYVEIDGKEVLLFTVDAPRQGDPIYCLQRQCDVEEVVTSGSTGQVEKRIKKTLPKGAIYVRHGGKTEQHTPEDLTRLTARAAAAERPTLDVEVLLDTSKAVTISESLVSDAHREGRLRAWREEMLAKLPRRKPKPARGPLDFMTLPSFDYSIQLPSRPIGEKRSEEEYEADVEEYAQAMRIPGAWLRAIAIEWVKERKSVLDVSVRNDTEQNYENAVIELTLLGLTRGNVFAAEGDAARLLPVPEEPEKWGDMSFIRPIGAARYPVTSIAAAARQPDVEEPSKGQVLVRYPELRIRPHTTHRLEPLLLALAPFMAGETVPVHWRVTTSSTDGHQEGDLILRVPGGAAASEPEAAEAQASP
ncbi:MAG: ATP-binding protein [Solirubrobacteraceae bacterium]